MHIYHFNTIPDINIESFLLHTGDVKLLQVTLALILSWWWGLSGSVAFLLLTFPPDILCPGLRRRISPSCLPSSRARSWCRGRTRWWRGRGSRGWWRQQWSRAGSCPSPRGRKAWSTMQTPPDPCPWTRHNSPETELNYRFCLLQQINFQRPWRKWTRDRRRPHWSPRWGQSSSELCPLQSESLGSEDGRWLDTWSRLSSYRFQLRKINLPPLYGEGNDGQYWGVNQCLVDNNLYITGNLGGKKYLRRSAPQKLKFTSCLLTHHQSVNETSSKLHHSNLTETLYLYSSVLLFLRF